jgi:hypothetical protein
MFSKLKLGIQILLYALIVGIGCRVFYTPLRTPLPLPQEAPHLLTTAADAEHLNLATLPPGCSAIKLPFHKCASSFVQFISEAHSSGYRIRTYRIFPVTLSIFFLLLIPALGLRRRGGCFETEDTAFWIAAFVITTPPFLCYGSLFLPLSFQALLFLSLLIAFRSYVQWPGYLSALFISLFISISISIDAEVAWVILLMIPAIAIGVGWRRIRLYWHNGHFIIFSLLLITLLLIGYYFNLIPPLPFPTLYPIVHHFLPELTWRFIWLTAGGFGFVAWVGLLFWIIYHPDRRWAKVFVTMFPLFFIASFGFTQGGAITVATISLSLLLLGMALSIIPSWRLRLLIGGSAILALAFSMPHFVRNHFTPYQTKHEQHLIAKTLLESCRTEAHWRKITLSIQDPRLCARLAWPIRRCQILPESRYNEAEVHITDQQPKEHPSIISTTTPVISLPNHSPIYIHSTCP